MIKYTSGQIATQQYPDFNETDDTWVKYEHHLDEISTKEAHIRHLKSVISDLKLTAKRDRVLIEQAAYISDI